MYLPFVFTLGWPNSSTRLSYGIGLVDWFTCNLCESWAGHKDRSPKKGVSFIIHGLYHFQKIIQLPRWTFCRDVFTGHLDGKSHCIDSYVVCYLLGLSEHPKMTSAAIFRGPESRSAMILSPTIAHSLSHRTLFSSFLSTIPSPAKNYRTIIDRTIDHFLSTTQTPCHPSRHLKG